MQLFFTLREQLASRTTTVIFLDAATQDTIPIDNFPTTSLLSFFKENTTPTTVFLDEQVVFAVPYLSPNRENYIYKEKLRHQGFETASLIQTHRPAKLQVVAQHTLDKEGLLAFLEGMTLALYRYEKISTTTEHTLAALQVEVVFKHNEILTQDELERLQVLCEGVFWARDLVNTPPNYKKPQLLAEQIQALGKKANFDVEIWDKARIETERMNGFLAIAKGSAQPPVFAKLTYAPQNAKNTQPVVLVGKGITYDIGGSNIKTQASVLEMMKSDIGGAAAVFGLFYALAKNEIPIYAIGLVPITDNMIGSQAILPSDVITMRSGKTVEVVNTDGEGRIILADALDYAKELAPELVIDLATLTGNAVRSIGEEGAVFMSNTDEVLKRSLEKSGREVYERLVEFPLWEEYRDYLKSEVADIKNVGGSTAGAIVGGKFLECFVNFDWIHIDLAAPAYLTKPSSYRGKNGTGYGVRLLYDFLLNEFV